MKNVFVTSGYINEAPQRALAEVLDAANVDLKFFREESYRRISRVKLQPILEAIRRYRELGVWLEVTTLVIPGINDSDTELRQIADFLCALSPDCGALLIERYGFYVLSNRERDGRCPECDCVIAGVGMDGGQDQLARPRR